MVLKSKSRGFHLNPRKFPVTENTGHLRDISEEATMSAMRANARLPPEVNRILFVKNLPFKITADEMYDIFGKYGAIRQIRMGNTPPTLGKAFVVFEGDELGLRITGKLEATILLLLGNAVDHLSGFNVCGRYIIVLYHQPGRTNKKQELKAKAANLAALKKQYGI
eukprot:1351495-Amorphochlora_amoeboformis.AAC.1